MRDLASIYLFTEAEVVIIIVCGVIITIAVVYIAYKAYKSS